jgi:hypothetical protein
MLTEAINEASNGRAVYIVAADRRHVENLTKQLAQLGGLGLGIKIETPPDLSNFDWERLRLRGAHPNCLVLVDHHAIESRYARILHELHRWDL